MALTCIWAAMVCAVTALMVFSGPTPSSVNAPVAMTIVSKGPLSVAIAGGDTVLLC